MKTLSDKYKYVSLVPSTCVNCSNSLHLKAMPANSPTHFSSQCKECGQVNSITYKELDKISRKFEHCRKVNISKLKKDLLRYYKNAPNNITANNQYLSGMIRDIHNMV